MNIIGIDPGKSGGIASINATGQASGDVMPIIGKEIDGHELARILTATAPDLVIIEKVGAMPKQGVTSTFTFGAGYGRLLGVCEALGIPYRLVTPQAWKKRVLAGTTKDKEAAIAFVKRAFPMVDLTPGKKRVPHDGIADAVCLAEYGRQLMAKGAA
ncbi:hypothetical protein [Ectothiorhodospira mobilis]|jgi:crossover junction endodeoxyribonuclease RuvC|uniref:hypothetical protein n=1 Tax=Ectothiorhodospira mobilis TaxID=195064 RepID=UPI001905F1DD|nr:hypothetical protein [Ectothiorhodospira mobilis]MBK1691097.1 hypothetical protein [Ectothiorhodospira mobilis]